LRQPGSIQELFADADSVGMERPSVEQPGAELESPRQKAAMMPDDPEALVEQLARLRQLAVYLNAHLVSPAVPEA